MEQVLEILPGMRFEKLKTIRLLTYSKHSWLVRCDCGAEKVFYASHLLFGRVSCGEKGCKRNGRLQGEAYPAEHRAWRKLRNYGVSGATICDRWLLGEDGKSGFECFLADMGRRPSPRYRVARYSENDGYQPDNCLWVTR